LTSVVDVYNRALGFAHARSRVASVGENSREAQICNDWYGLVRDTVQEAAHWDFCRRIERLALLSERDFSSDWVLGDPDPQYKYTYALPDDYLRAWYLTNYAEFVIRFDSSRSRRVISTNVENATLVYATQNDIPSTWSSGHIMAVASGLASYITGPLTGQYNLIEFNLQRANRILEDAQAANINSEDFQLDSIPPWIEVRGYIDNAPRTRFYYPYGSLFTAAHVNVDG